MDLYILEVNTLVDDRSLSIMNFLYQKEIKPKQ